MVPGGMGYRGGSNTLVVTVLGMTQSDTPRPIRSSRQARRTKGFDWKPPAEAPGAVLPPEVARAQRERLQEIDDTQRRARVRSSSYYVG
jgi:hypothetical protein